MLDNRDRRVAGKINGQRVVVLGWPRAILMQVAHPLVAAGVSQHSEFSDSGREAIRRLRRTLRAMLTLTFGDEAEARAAAAHINAIHDRVHGFVEHGTERFPPGHAYTAHDAHLLLWVHATFVESTALAYELLVGPLTDEEKDEYTRGAASTGPMLGIPASIIPTEWAALRAYVTETLRSDIIEVTPAARRIAREVLRPPFPGLLRPASWLANLPSLQLLPAELRRAYGLRWDRREARLAGLLAGSSRVACETMPAVLRKWPEARSAPGQPSGKPARAGGHSL